MNRNNGDAVASERRPLLDNSVPDTSYESTQNGHGVQEPGSPAESTLNKLSKSDLRWIMAGLWSAIFLASLDGTVVATLITPIGSYFNKSHQSSYIGSVFLLSACCFTPLYGRLSDIFGRKGAMTLALILFGSGTLLCAIAPTMALLIAARAVAGMGGGGIVTVASISMSDLIPLKERGIYQGLANLIFTIGAGLGGPVGGLINDRLGWRAAFFVQLPILGLSMILILAKLNIKLSAKLAQNQTLPEKMARIDWGGSFTLVSFLGALLVALSLKSLQELPWSSPWVAGLLVISVVFFALFIVVEKYWAKEPVLPMRLVMRRTPFFMAISSLLFSGASYALIYNVPLYISAVRLHSATNAGLHLVPFTIASATGALLAGGIMKRTGKYWLLLVIAALLAVLSTVLTTFWDVNTASWRLWFDGIPFGLGLAAGGTGMLIALIASVTREEVAVATGISYLFRSVGSVLGVSLNGLLVQSILVPALQKRITGPGAAQIIDEIRHSTAIIPTLEPHLREAAVESYQLATRAVFIVQVVVCILGFFAVLPIQEFALPGTLEEQEAEERRRTGAAAPHSSD